MSEEDAKEILKEIYERKEQVMFWSDDDDYYLGEYHGLLFVEELIKKKITKE